MSINKRYALAKERYAQIGIDTDAAINTLQNISISMHCWQGDDVQGFEGSTQLSGGIQATGNYPGKARSPQELMQDIDKALSLIPGRHRLNLHASYAIFKDTKTDRDALLPEHFKDWVDFAKSRRLSLDFNPTFFSHKMADSGLTLSHPDRNIRQFWINHAKRTRKIAEYFGKAQGNPCLHNIWIPDGYKDIPADRLSPRLRLKESLDEIFSEKLDKNFIFDSLESKVFGIGVESYTVGSHEFYLNYCAKNNLICLLDNGHFHPTESVADKISSMLLFFDKLALHVTRPVRWDSDHVVLLDEEIKQIALEIVRCKALDKVLIGLDYFDAGINRVAAWVVGMRNMQKALLIALLTPHEDLAILQNEGNFTELMVKTESLKTFPFGDVWDYFCEKNGVPTDDKWLEEVKTYEKTVLFKRT